MRYVFMVVVVALCMGCGSHGGGDAAKDWGGQAGDDVFRNAVPDPASLKLDVPGADAAGASTDAADPGSAMVMRATITPTGTVSKYYQDTVKMTRDVNGLVFFLLEMLETVLSYPPTQRSDNVRIWGPWDPDDALSQVHWRFRISKTQERGVFDYTLELSPKTGPDDWTAAWEGSMKPDADHPRHGTGDFTLHFDDIARLDTTSKNGGDVHVVYDTITDGKKIDIDFSQFKPEDNPDGPRVDGVYAYHSKADGRGRYSFKFKADLHAEDPAVDLPGLETLEILSMWQASGEGRAEAAVTGEDLLSQGLARFSAVECWDTGFLTTYSREQVDPKDSSVAPYVNETGVEAECPPSVEE